MEDKPKRILIVDDEQRIRSLLKMYLEKEGYLIDEAEDGETALYQAMHQTYELIVLDVMLPGIDGLEVCRRLREVKCTPILMLTAKGEEMNRLQGFEMGVDDYVVKPFSPREVVHRIKAILRRFLSADTLSKDDRVTNHIVFKDLVIDHDAHRVLVNGQEVSLTPKEYELLYYLAVSPDKVFSREQLLKDVWHYQFFGDVRTVDTHVKRLREKLSKSSPQCSLFITTVWGVGYKFETSK